MNDEEKKHFHQILRTIDKLDRVGLYGVYQLLTIGKKDESGAFVAGVGLDKVSALQWCYFIAPREIQDKIDKWIEAEKLPPLFSDERKAILESGKSLNETN